MTSGRGRLRMVLPDVLLATSARQARAAPPGVRSAIGSTTFWAASRSRPAGTSRHWIIARRAVEPLRGTHVRSGFGGRDAPREFGERFGDDGACSGSAASPLLARGMKSRRATSGGATGRSQIEKARNRPWARRSSRSAS